MGTSVNGKSVRSDQSQLPKPDSDESDKDLGGDSSSNSMGLQVGINESECSSDSNPNAVGNDSGHCPLPHSDSEDTTQRGIDGPKWITPAMKSLLKTNVAIFAAEYKKMKQKRGQSDDSTSLSSEGSSSGKPQESLETVSLKNQEMTDIMLKEFGDLNLQGEAKDDTLISLISELKNLQKQVKERREWAHEKALQAAKRLCQDMNDLKKLRMEKDEREKPQEVKEENTTLEENPTVKSLDEVETALRKARGQLDQADMVMKRLEVENMEIRAEKEAAQLSASESKALCKDADKRAKKHQKEVLAWETERAKLREEITSENQKLMDLHQEILKVEAAKKTVEGKWREVQKAKEGALARIQQERRLKEETEANIKRKQESLQSKLDLECKRYKDNIKRLEEELERMKKMVNPPQDLTNRVQHDTIGKCVICRVRGASVVFLPCQHQVVCGGCNDQRKNKCPDCGDYIQQWIRVFGAC